MTCEIYDIFESDFFKFNKLFYILRLESFRTKHVFYNLKSLLMADNIIFERLKSNINQRKIVSTVSKLLIFLR